MIGNAASGHRSARRRVGSRRNRVSSMRGVTLLEMLLVVALLAVASLLAAAALSGGFRGMQLHTAAKEIAAQLRYTRARAISTGQSTRFTIDPAKHAWTGANDHAGEIPDALTIRFTGARELQPAAGQGAIVFFDDGAASGGTIQLSLEDAAWNIDVAWLTGQVTLERAEVVR